MNPFILLSLCAWFGCQGATQAPPVATPATTASEVDKILDAMEIQGATMKDYTASATMEKFEALTDEREVRRGRVVVRGPSGADRQIGIAFDEFIDSDGRGSTDSRRFVFDRGWLWELDPARKQAIRRQLAREGEPFDPLRVGEGPFPVPLGQPKRDVLREFTVAMTIVPDAPFFRSLTTAKDSTTTLTSLRLVPRAGTAMARDTAAMTIILEGASFMPRGVEVEAINGNRTRVLLRDGRLNLGLDETALALLAPPSTEGWKIDNRPLN